MGKGILIIDFGSQYVQLIARRIRESNVLSIVRTPDISVEEVRSLDPAGIILSGGPNSVYDKSSPSLDERILKMGRPVLGICYGMQLLAKFLGGSIAPNGEEEYGKTMVNFNEDDPLFRGVKNTSVTWMSHCDNVVKPPAGFKVTATSAESSISAFSSVDGSAFGVQFHPEVAHTPEGGKILENFIFSICGCNRDWTMEEFLKTKIRKIREEVNDQHVILGLSGGVDSTVSAVLLNQAIGDKLHCIFVDNGLLRKNERLHVKKLFGDHVDLDLKIVQAQDRFLKALEGVIDPEDKRKKIGHAFIEVFDDAASEIEGVSFLAQGTLYPDIIESCSYFGGPSKTIKSHHNVGGLPEKMGLKVLEPLKELFKDEVRKLGRELGLSDRITQRQPFPGPGLAVRVLGEVTKKRLDILREADWLIIDIAKKHGVYDNTWQVFGVLLPVKSVGVMGDNRTYENVLAIRAVNSVDGMTADWARIPYDVLGEMSNRIINSVAGINRVVYDISSKPPGTIEWE